MSSQNHNSGTYRVLWNPNMLSSHVYGHSGGKKKEEIKIDWKRDR